MFKNLNLFRTKKQLEKQRYKTILVGEKNHNDIVFPRRIHIFKEP